MNNADWRIRKVKKSTRQKIKIYSIQRNVTIAQALEQLIDKALNGSTS